MPGCWIVPGCQALKRGWLSTIAVLPCDGHENRVETVSRIIIVLAMTTNINLFYQLLSAFWAYLFISDSIIINQLSVCASTVSLNIRSEFVFGVVCYETDVVYDDYY